MKKLKVGIIGSGNIVVNGHLPAYLKRSNEVEVVAITGTTPEKLERLSKQYNIPNIFTDYHKMLKEVEPDVVSVCTPNYLHAPASIAALQAGCHVFCEKPPATTVKELKEMKRVSELNNRIITFNYHHRFSSEVDALKKFSNNGEFGNIYSARIQALRRRGIPGWGTFTNQEIQGGGPLIDIGIHMLDLCLYLMDFPEPKTVLGATHQRIGNKPGIGLMGSWNPEEYTVEDSATGMIRFNNGASVSIETSYALNIEEESVMNVHLFGDKGGASVFPPKIFQEKHANIVNTSLPFLEDVNKSERSINHFIDCCLNRTKPLVTLEQSMIVQKIINGIYTSAETGKAVNF